MLDLEERLWVSIASERKAEALSTQLIAFAAFSARFEQQLTSKRANDERIRQCLRSHHWTDAEIHTLASTQPPSNNTLQAVHGALLSVKPVRLDRADKSMLSAITLKSSSGRGLDPQTFTLLTDPQVMARVPVADWKMDLEVPTIIEILKE